MRRSSLLIALATALLFTSAPAADAAKLGTRQIRIGSQGGDVKQLQRSLRALGYHISVDGDFGPQTDGAVRMGLRRDTAMQIAAQMVQGAARMVLQTGMHPAALKDQVTTPAGSTIAGLLILEDGRIRSVIARAVEEAAKTAGRLGQTSGQKTPDK